MLNAINRIREWFVYKGWKPFDFQEEVWQAYLNGESGLIYSPTGTGKTYAAWLGPLIEWMSLHPDLSSDDNHKRSAAPSLRILWITPLRALAADTTAALQTALEELNIHWTVETRTGDTSTTIR